MVMMSFHFIRPWWLLLLGPLLVSTWRLYTFRHAPAAWASVCDSHLLPYLLKKNDKRSSFFPWLFLLLSTGFMVISLAGPTWSQWPVATYQPIQPRIIVLDMSSKMLENDLSPNRLRRAKFKLHDLLQQQDTGQFGFIVYTSEPFVVSPLTDDGKTIDALLSSLTEDVMPVDGNRLNLALIAAMKLLHQAGFQHGELLVMTAKPPSPKAIEMAGVLAKKGIQSSIMPIRKDVEQANPAFKQFAKAGQGEWIPFSDTSEDVEYWLRMSSRHYRYKLTVNQDIPLWRDQGRLFLIPALLLLLPLFRRRFIQGANA